MTEGPNVGQGKMPDDSAWPGSQGLSLDRDVASSVTVLFFASAREATHTRRASFQSPTVAKLTEQLRSAYGPELELLLPTCAVWVNGSPATPETRLQDGDEVAVLPPVSGGCEADEPPAPPEKNTQRKKTALETTSGKGERCRPVFC